MSRKKSNPDLLESDADLQNIEEITEFHHKVIAICINKSFNERDNIYDCVRKWWRLNPKRANGRYVLAEKEGIVKGVFQVNGEWFRDKDDVRWQFNGEELKASKNETDKSKPEFYFNKKLPRKRWDASAIRYFDESYVPTKNQTKNYTGQMPDEGILPKDKLLQEAECKTNLRCEKMMDIIINHICKKKTNNANIVTIFYKSLAEAMNDDKLEFDNHLTFNQRTPATNSNAKIDGETKLGSLLGEIHYKCENLNIPHLNYLVVRKTDGKCGDGANFGLNEENERKNIWQYDWNLWRNVKDIVNIIDKIETNPEKKEYIREQWIRDSKVRRQVLDNAKGICQGCKQKSFEKENGKIYLEVHHKVYLSQNGLDTLDNCVALCPNCHKNEHFGKKNNRKFAEGVGK